MMSLLKNSLSFKIIITLVIVLAVSFGALSFAIVKVQSSLLGSMIQKVDSRLLAAEKNAVQQFKTLETNVEKALRNMGGKVAADLSASTATALSKEEKRIRDRMRMLLETNAKAVSSLLVSVAATPIMDKKHDQLKEFSKSVAQTREILFAFFLDDQDTLLPGYVNYVDDRILSYIEEGRGETDAQKVLEQAKNDPNVFIHEEKIEYFGIPLGKSLVCISTEFVAKEIKTLGNSFAALQANNSKTVKEVLQTESSTVTDRISSELGKVNRKNSRSITETESILKTSASDVKSRISMLTALTGTACCIAIIVVLGFCIRFLVISPIRSIADGLKDISEGEGDLTKRLSTDRADEIGRLTYWFDAFMARLNNIIVDIGRNSETVTSSSSEALSVSEKMNKNCASLSGKADSVATASEEMSTGMGSIAAASEQASTNMSAVADAAGQMKHTLDEVAENCNKAKEIADNASLKVESAVGKVGRLGESAKEVSQVTEVITDIADRTGLLALNATIEAARAGESGKGFAVVAAEIKELATQTRNATKDIKGKIDGIQSSTSETVTEVSSISSVITDVNDIVSSIASAMDEQAATTSEVTGNIEQASSGISDVTENVTQSSQVAAEIAGDISEVNTIAEEMKTRGARMKKSSEDLASLSSNLRDMISVFKVSRKEERQTESGEAEKASGGTGRKTALSPEDIPDLFEWSEELETGIEKVDSQHRNLMEMINRLHRAMRVGKGAEETGGILDELADYSIYHFGFEEELFDTYGYPDAESHRELHRKAAERIKTFQEQFRQGQASVAMDLMHFLTGWLKEHIMKTDMAFAPFLKDEQ